MKKIAITKKDLRMVSKRLKKQQSLLFEGSRAHKLWIAVSEEKMELTIKDAANYLGVNYNQIIRLCSNLVKRSYPIAPIKGMGKIYILRDVTQKVEWFQEIIERRMNNYIIPQIEYIYRLTDNAMGSIIGETAIKITHKNINKIIEKSNLLKNS